MTRWPAAVAVVLTAPAIHGQPADDGAYGRFDGDLDLGLGLGTEVQSGAPRAAVRATAHFLSMAGVYALYSDALGEPPARRASFGVDLRPLFLPRFTQGYEQGPDFVDLALDSCSLGLGAYFAPQSTRGFEASLGFGLPLVGTAGGPWVDARAAVLVPDEGRDSVLAGFVSISWHALIETELANRGVNVAVNRRP